MREPAPERAAARTIIPEPAPVADRDRERPAVDSAIDQADGIGASGMDSAEAHEGGLATDRGLGNEPVRDTADTPEQPDQSFNAGYALDEDDADEDRPVFDRGEELLSLRDLARDDLADDEDEDTAGLLLDDEDETPDDEDAADEDERD